MFKITDFSKAIDRLDHNILIKKPLAHGFSISMLNFVSCYLSNCKQYVECSGFQSLEVLATSGVPQVSNLGPLHFDIFINDIICDLNVNCLIYVDDLKRYCNIKNNADCVILQNNFDKINEWRYDNKLPLNASKCDDILE